jgi:hypothetical protein
VIPSNFSIAAPVPDRLRIAGLFGKTGNQFRHLPATRIGARSPHCLHTLLLQPIHQGEPT